VDLVYYDRFSPINPKTQSRVLTEMTATLKVLGGGASWKGLSDFFVSGDGFFARRGRRGVVVESGIVIFAKRV